MVTSPTPTNTGTQTTPSVDTTPPTPPGNLTASAGDGQASLLWSASTDSVGVTGYSVYRDGAKVGQTAGTGFSETGLANGTAYSYYVVAYDAAGNVSAASNTVSATPSSASQPSAPPPTCSSSATFCATYDSSWAPWDGFNGTPNGGIGNWGFGFTNSYFSFANSVVAQGTQSFKATVDGGSAAGGQAGQRTLVQNWPNDIPSQSKSRGYQGSDTWYRTRLYFPADFDPAPNTAWNWLIEWHDWPDSACCANIGFTVDTDTTDGGPAGGERLSVRILGGGDASHPVDNLNIGDSAPASFRKSWYPGPNIQRGHWYDILVHVKWDYTSSGLVEYWLDGAKAVTYNGPTLFWFADNNPNFAGASAGPGQTYWMEGYYRGSGSSTESVYHDAAEIGPTLASVS